jgi:hypothetical protein
MSLNTFNTSECIFYMYIYIYIYIYIYMYIYVLWYWSFELCISHLLGKHSTPSATSMLFLAIVIFQIESPRFCLRWLWNLIFLPKPPIQLEWQLHARMTRHVLWDKVSQMILPRLATMPNCICFQCIQSTLFCHSELNNIQLYLTYHIFPL